MPFDVHERAQFLIDEARVAGITPQDESWLQTHVAECAQCARFQDSTARMLDALDGFVFDAEPVRVRPAARRPHPAWRWALAAAAVVLLAAMPVYQSVRAERQARADAQLLRDVESGLTRTVPRAMEPLVHAQTGESQ